LVFFTQKKLAAPIIFSTGSTLQIRLLEQTVREIRSENSSRFDELRRLLDEERAARNRAETELEALRRSNLR
jgi:hypothetical protein